MDTAAAMILCIAVKLTNINCPIVVIVTNFPLGTETTVISHLAMFIMLPMQLVKTRTKLVTYWRIITVFIRKMAASRTNIVVVMTSIVDIIGDLITKDITPGDMKTRHTKVPDIVDIILNSC